MIRRDDVAWLYIASLKRHDNHFIMEIQLQLFGAVARQLQPYLDHALRAQCNGCLVDHPSQYQHKCIMLEGEDGIRYGLELVLFSMG